MFGFLRNTTFLCGFLWFLCYRIYFVYILLLPPRKGLEQSRSSVGAVQEQPRADGVGAVAVVVAAPVAVAAVGVVVASVVAVVAVGVAVGVAVVVAAVAPAAAVCVRCFFLSVS